MDTKVAVDMKTKQPSLNGRTNRSPKRPNVNKQAVRTTQISKMTEIFLTNPDSVTREEFLLFQSAIGYRQAVRLLEEGKRRKRNRLIGQSKTLLKSPIAQKVQTENASKPEQLKEVNGKGLASKQGLPDKLRSGLENLSGVDLSNISVHQNSNKPQQVGALAYTKGNDIHIAPGQKKHLPHEGWHAVQQKQGRVKPTLQMKTGTLVNDDAGLEKEADVMGSKAIQVGSQSNMLQLKEFSKIDLGENKGNVIQREKANLFQEAIFLFKAGLVDKLEKTFADAKKAAKGTGKYEKQYVTVEQLKQLGWTTATDAMVADLNKVLVKYNITTPERIRYFISQTMKESNKGLWLTEAAWLSIEAQKEYCSRYDNRKDLGNRGKGEGFKFRGVGYINVTGRNNYQAFADAMGDQEIVNKGADYVKEKYAWEAAGYWWKNNGMNAIIDSGSSVREVTLKVNPGLIHNKKELDKQIIERGTYYNQTTDVFK